MATKTQAMAVVTVAGMKVMLPLEQALVAFQALAGGRVVQETYGEGAPFKYLPQDRYTVVSMQHLSLEDVAKMSLEE